MTVIEPPRRTGTGAKTDNKMKTVKHILNRIFTSREKRNEAWTRHASKMQDLLDFEHSGLKIIKWEGPIPRFPEICR